MGNVTLLREKKRLSNEYVSIYLIFFTDPFYPVYPFRKLFYLNFPHCQWTGSWVFESVLWNAKSLITLYKPEGVHICTILLRYPTLYVSFSVPFCPHSFLDDKRANRPSDAYESASLNMHVYAYFVLLCVGNESVEWVVPKVSCVWVCVKYIRSHQEFT